MLFSHVYFRAYIDKNAPSTCETHCNLNGRLRFCEAVSIKKALEQDAQGLF
ncbi:hypothetical protein [Flectobacillus rivi]|uniref:Uncharacterized protein n=1 Tax=Flectobacillus rivi TaxID=2984209 RepID=A0ABT6YWM3_9BACT|nr:hypothetical protein [Flectobacillus rivi]MDI9873288.1 hypothetical protein [Flectobacillus rivi]